MIFVTVGHQMPFDRLVHAVDQWASKHGEADVFAQIGRSHFHPSHFLSVPYLTPQEFHQRMSQATAVVSHAGTGTILSAVKMNKPLLVLPRLVCHRETRSDHQIETARYFAEKGYILAAGNEDELVCKLENLEEFQPTAKISNRASDDLIHKLREFIFASL